MFKQYHCRSIQRRFWPYLSGEMSSERERAALESHLSSCVSCRIEFSKKRDSLASLVEGGAPLLKTMATEVVSPKPPEQKKRINFSLLAVLALIAVSAGLGWHEFSLSTKGSLLKFASFRKPNHAASVTPLPAVSAKPALQPAVQTTSTAPPQEDKALVGENSEAAAPDKSENAASKKIDAPNTIETERAFDETPFLVGDQITAMFSSLKASPRKEIKPAKIIAKMLPAKRRAQPVRMRRAARPHRTATHPHRAVHHLRTVISRAKHPVLRKQHRLTPAHHPSVTVYSPSGRLVGKN